MNAAKFTSRHLDAELKKKSIDRTYLFTGEEEGEKEKSIKRIIDILRGDNGEDACTACRFHIELDEFYSAFEFAMSQSMFSEKKICIIYNIDVLAGKENLQLLDELINDMPAPNILVMTVSGNRPPQFIAPGMLNKIKVVQFWRYFENDLYPYISGTIRRYGIEIERGAVSLLVELLGSDIRKIDGALERMAYSGEKLITPGIVESCVQFEKDITVFDFIDSLFKKDKKAVDQLVRIIENGVYELSVLSLIFRQAELIEKYHDLVGNGLAREEAAEKVGVFPRNRKNFLEQTGHFSQKDIRTVFPLISRADYRIKSRSFSGSMLENPVFELVASMII